MFFTDKEIACPCCNKILDTEEFNNHLEMLRIARSHSNTPFIINSWTRCKKHNKEVNGSVTSSHLKGIATDIKYKNDTELFNIVDSLLLSSFNRILIYPKSKFIHVDSDHNKVQCIIKIMEL